MYLFKLASGTDHYLLPHQIILESGGTEFIYQTHCRQKERETSLILQPRDFLGKSLNIKVIPKNKPKRIPFSTAEIF